MILTEFLTLNENTHEKGKTLTLMKIASAAISLDVFDYTQASTQFKCMQTWRKV